MLSPLIEKSIGRHESASITFFTIIEANFEIRKIDIKSKVFYGQDPLEENLLPLFIGLIIIVTCINVIEVAQWVNPSCYRLQPVTDNGVRDDRTN